MALVRKPSHFRQLLLWTEHLLAGVGLCYLVGHFTFQITAMTSGSMAPTLQGTTYDNGDRVALEKVTHWFRSPRRWEIYFFYEPDGTPVAKRIVALPGEKIAIRKNRVYINGTELKPPEELKFLKYYDYGDLGCGREADCGSGYYMLGDDSEDSMDSRY